MKPFDALRPIPSQWYGPVPARRTGPAPPPKSRRHRRRRASSAKAEKCGSRLPFGRSLDMSVLPTPSETSARTGLPAGKTRVLEDGRRPQRPCRFLSTGLYPTSWARAKSSWQDASAPHAFAFPFFWMLNTGETWVVWLAIVIGLSFGVASVSGSIAAFYSELFETRIRFTGFVLAREVSGAVVGGFIPLLATSRVIWSDGRSWPVSIYMIVTVLIGFLCAYLSRDFLAPRSFALKVTAPRSLTVEKEAIAPSD